MNCSFISSRRQVYSSEGILCAKLNSTKRRSSFKQSMGYNLSYFVPSDSCCIEVGRDAHVAAIGSILRNAGVALHRDLKGIGSSANCRNSVSDGTYLDTCLTTKQKRTSSRLHRQWNLLGYRRSPPARTEQVVEFLEAVTAVSLKPKLSGFCGPKHNCLTMSRRCSPAASSGHGCSLLSQKASSLDHIEASFDNIEARIRTPLNMKGWTI